MINENARGICSAACMGDPRGCLTFSKLNDLGMVGACALMFAGAYQTA